MTETSPFFLSKYSKSINAKAIYSEIVVEKIWNNTSDCCKSFIKLDNYHFYRCGVTPCHYKSEACKKDL